MFGDRFHDERNLITRNKVLRRSVYDIECFRRTHPNGYSIENLLFREKVRFTTDPSEKSRLIALADEWFDRALETRKRNMQLRQSAAPGARATIVAPPPPPRLDSENEKY